MEIGGLESTGLPQSDTFDVQESALFANESYYGEDFVHEY